MAKKANEVSTWFLREVQTRRVGNDALAMDTGDYCSHGGREAGIFDLGLGGSNDSHGVQDYAPIATGAEAGPL